MFSILRRRSRRLSSPRRSSRCAGGAVACSSFGASTAGAGSFPGAVAKRSPPTRCRTLADSPTAGIGARLSRTRERVDASQIGHVQRRLAQADLANQALILAALAFTLLVPVLVTLAALLPLGSARSLPAGVA